MQLWTYEHFISYVPAFIVIVAASVAMRHFLVKSEHKSLLPLQIIGVLLILLEIGKQIASFGDNGYNLYSIPLHYCSLLLFFIPASAFWRGKYTHAVRTLAAAFGSALFLFMAVYPALIYSSWNVENAFSDFLSFHTIAFHVFAVFAFVVIVMLDLQTPNIKRDLPVVILGTGIYCVVAAIMAQVLKTNFNNFYTCNIGPLESVRLSVIESLGYFLGQTFYVLIVIVLNIIFTALAYLFYVGLCKLKTLAFRSK